MGPIGLEQLELCSLESMNMNVRSLMSLIMGQVMPDQ